ncbi:MAG: S-layer homology domain-containing protein, partial [Thermomicrobiales bacterium]
MNSAVLALWPQRRLYWLLAGVALIALVGGLLGSGAMRGPHAREVAGPGGSTGTSGVSAATTGPTLALHLDGAGLAPPSGVVTFLATVAAGGAPLADLEASSSGVDQQWQTLATFTGTGPVAVATGFNITDPAYGGSTATGSRTVLVRVRDAAGGSASATLQVNYSATLPIFSDVPGSAPYTAAVRELAARGVIQGYGANTCANAGYAAPCFGPADATLRAQMAALIARALGWDQETWPNPFPDQGSVDDALWRNVGTLNHYDVARGYANGAYRPTAPVLKAQVISFITRAMVARGYWEPQPDQPGAYPTVPDSSGARGDLATYQYYIGAAPDTASASAFSDWDQPASRAWFAQAEWPAVQWRENPANWNNGTGKPKRTPTPVLPPITPTATMVVPTPTSAPTTVIPTPTSTPTTQPTPTPTTVAPTPTPTPTPMPQPTATPTPPPTGGSNHSIAVGLGFSDVSPHQIVRTSDDRLWIVVPDAGDFQVANNKLHVYRATSTGTPGAFAEQDTAHAPGSSAAIITFAIAVDGADTLHIAWTDAAGAGSVKYATFNTTTGQWNAPVVTLDGATGFTSVTQGDEGVALALDASGAPHVVYQAGDANRTLKYTANLGGAWTAPARVDDQPLSGNFSAMHPALAFAPNGDLYLAWLTGTFNYRADGQIWVRRRDHTSQTWVAATRVGGAAEVAMTAIDNGPSLLVTGDSVVHITFLNSGRSTPDS